MQGLGLEPESPRQRRCGAACLPRDSKVEVRLPGKGVSNSPMARGRSTKTLQMINWIRTSRLSIKN